MGVLVLATGICHKFDMGSVPTKEHFICFRGIIAARLQPLLELCKFALFLWKASAKRCVLTLGSISVVGQKIVSGQVTSRVLVFRSKPFCVLV